MSSESQQYIGWSVCVFDAWSSRTSRASRASWTKVNTARGSDSISLFCAAQISVRRRCDSDRTAIASDRDCNGAGSTWVFSPQKFSSIFILIVLDRLLRRASSARKGLAVNRYPSNSLFVLKRLKSHLKSPKISENSQKKKKKFEKFNLKLLRNQCKNV